MHADPKSIIFISAGFTVLHMKHKYIKYHKKKLQHTQKI